MKKALSAVSLLGLVLLAGCGQKGPLYLPHQNSGSQGHEAGAARSQGNQNPAANRNTGPGTATLSGGSSGSY